MVRRNVFDKVGIFDEAITNADDVDMWFRIARAGHLFAFIDRPLISYRINTTGVSARRS